METYAHDTPADRYCELIMRHERMLRWLCLRRARGNPDLADDYFQEVSLSLWRALPDIAPGIPIRQERSYVRRAALYTLGHCSRHLQPDLSRLSCDLSLVLNAQPDAAADEDEHYLDEIIALLPPQMRTLLGLYRSGYTLDEIALYLDINPSAARQRYHRAILMLRAIDQQETTNAETNIT